MNNPTAQQIQERLCALNRLYIGDEKEQMNVHLAWFHSKRIWLYNDVKTRKYDLCSLKQIHDCFPFDLLGLDVAAGVELLTVYQMLIDVPVTKAHAEAVLHALAALLEGPYSLDTVRVEVLE